MRKLSGPVARSDIYNDLFLLTYVLHRQSSGNFDALKNGQLEKGDCLDLARICIAQIMELMKRLELPPYPVGTEPNEKTYQVLRDRLLILYLQRNYFSANEKMAAKAFAEEMLKACIEQYSEDKLKKEFSGLGPELVSQNGIRLFYKKAEWGMDFKFDLNWPVEIPIPTNNLQSIKKRWKEDHGAEEVLLVEEIEVYQNPDQPSKRNYDQYYESEKSNAERKLAELRHHFKNNLLQTTYLDTANELKRYQNMQRTHWVGRFFGMDPANIGIASALLWELGVIRKSPSSSIEKLNNINNLFYDAIEKLKKASSKRLLSIVSRLHRNFLSTFERAGFTLQENVEEMSEKEIKMQ